MTWLTNHHPSVVWHCWLSHLTRKVVSEMTYNVSSGTLNPTIPSSIIYFCANPKPGLMGRVATGRASNVKSWGLLFVCSHLRCSSHLRCNTDCWLSDSMAASGFEDSISTGWEGEQYLLRARGTTACWVMLSRRKSCKMSCCCCFDAKCWFGLKLNYMMLKFNFTYANLCHLLTTVIKLMPFTVCVIGKHALKNDSDTFINNCNNNSHKSK